MYYLEFDNVTLKWVIFYFEYDTEIYGIKFKIRIYIYIFFFKQNELLESDIWSSSQDPDAKGILANASPF